MDRSYSGFFALYQHCINISTGEYKICANPLAIRRSMDMIKVRWYTYFPMRCVLMGKVGRHGTNGNDVVCTYRSVKTDMADDRSDNATADGTFDTIEEELAYIIENAKIRILFQPIVSLRDGEVLGYEALSRGPQGMRLYDPDPLFEAAVQCGKLWELEQLCRTKALQAAYKNQIPARLFLNVNPAVIHDEKFKNGFTKEYLQRFNIDPGNIFFEISEKNAVRDLDGFKATIDHYKKQNYKIAIDDAGAGYSGLNMITDVHPHYIKLDMNLVRGIHQDAYKKALVNSLYEFSTLAEISLIAEGIETEEELRTLIGIGIQYGQGYFIQRPDQELSPIRREVLESIRTGNIQKNHQYRNVSSFYIGYLGYAGITVKPDDAAGSVHAYFQEDPGLIGVTVIDDQNRVVGTVSRTRIDRAMSGKYGFSLYARRPISNIMDLNPLITDFTAPIDIVTKRAMSRPPNTLYDHIVVSNEGTYCGMVTIKDLLEKTMEIEVLNSRNLNPLSALPGNLVIEQNLEKYIQSNESFTVLYIDLDNFKAYNDVYGFGNGDKVIRFIAGLLEQIIPAGSFIGHIGGDDFVAILQTHDIDAVCRALIRQFDEGILQYYTPEDKNRGYILSRDRRGKEDQFPIMSVSVAGVSNRTKMFATVSEIAEFAGELKKQCKLIWKSCHIVV